MISVLIADDQDLVREGLRMLLEAEPDLAVAGEAADGSQALAQARLLDPDVILMDVRMPRMNGIELLREVRNDPALCSTTVVVLTTSKDEQDMIDAYNLNVAGYLVKPVTFANFCEVMVALNKYWSLVEFP